MLFSFVELERSVFNANVLLEFLWLEMANVHRKKLTLKTHSSSQEKRSLKELGITAPSEVQLFSLSFFGVCSIGTSRVIKA